MLLSDIARQGSPRLRQLQPLDPVRMNNGTFMGALASGLTRGLQAYDRQKEAALDRAAGMAMAEAAANARRPAGPTFLIPEADARKAGFAGRSGRPARGWGGVASSLRQQVAAAPALAGRLVPYLTQAGLGQAGLMQVGRAQVGLAPGTSRPRRPATITAADIATTMRETGMTREQVVARLRAEGRI